MKEEIWYRLSTAILKTGVRKTAGTAAGKLASLSVRAKITLRIISLGAVAAVGGTTYAVVTQNSDTELTQAEEAQKESQTPLKENGDTDIGMMAEKPETETMGTETSEVEDADTEGTQKATYRDVLSDPSSYTQDYPSDTDFNSI